MSKKILNFDKFWQEMERFLRSIPSNKVIYNQYNNPNDDFGIPGASSVRLANLKSYLKGVSGHAKVLVVGEAPSYCGTRFSGVPLAAEKQLIHSYDTRDDFRDFPIKGKRSSNFSQGPCCSDTDRIFWKVMQKHYPGFISWNAFPFHPHKSGIPLSNRRPTKIELSQCKEALTLIKEYFHPSHIIAVGGTAMKHLMSIGEKPPYLKCVRHPAYGGKAEFVDGMQNLFEISIGDDLKTIIGECNRIIDNQ